MKGYEQIAANAVRLLEDAIVLHKNERYRTSLALAMLSIEESAKACYVKWRDLKILSDNSFRTFLSHSEKHRLIFSYFFIKQLFNAIELYYKEEENLPQLPIAIIDGKTPEEVSRILWDACMTNRDPQFFEQTFKYAIDGMGSSFLYADMLIYDHLKQMGFYEDYDENGNILPNILGREWDWPGLSQDIIDNATQLSKLPGYPRKMHEIMAGIFEIGPHISAHDARRNLRNLRHVVHSVR